MDEQRMQAYVGLIEQLLDCPQGKETEILQANANLVDRGLVAVMGQYADWLESLGDRNAGRLRQLAQMLELGSPSNQSLEEAVAFGMEMMQLIHETRGDQTQVYEFFEANVARLDEALLRALPNLFLVLIQQVEPALVASMLDVFGNLIAQFPLGNQMLNLELAIAAYQQALQVFTRDAFPEAWAWTQANLAATYRSRICGERAENLEQVITACELALQVFTRDAFPEAWARIQANLAIAYNNRIRGERAENLEQAITACELALQVYTRDTFPEAWARIQANLSSVYLYRICGERAENLEQAITACELALQVYTRDAFPEAWARTQNNLANAYLYRICGERAENLEQAITACELALQVYTRDAFPEAWAGTQHNLANAYLYRIRGERAENLEQAVTAYELALQIRTRNAFPQDCRDTAQNLGNLHFQEKSWAPAVDAYQIATGAAEALYQASISYDGKCDELKATAGIPRRLAYAQAQVGDVQAALINLERGRARGLSESLSRDRADLAQLTTLAPTLYNEYQEITQQLRNLENIDRARMVSTERDRIPADLICTTTKLRQQLGQTIAKIRQVPNYENFLTPTQWQDIRAALRPDQPLVYLVTTPNGSMALIVTVDNIDVLWLDDLTEPQLLDLLNQTWLAAYRQSRTNPQGWYDAIDTATRQLWDTLMGPLVQKLQSLNFTQATLIPTGYLSLLPLHAAWVEDSSKPTGRRYALDDLHITYSPNAQSLNAARFIANSVQADSILAIDEPHHRIQDLKTGEYKPVSPLPSSSKEVESAVSTFQNPSILRHDQATRAAVIDALPHTTILHCSCHGTANLSEPLQSGLLMSDGLLTLKDIFALNLTEGDRGLRLAILSACETGMIGIENADEAISLPTGLLQAGVAAVIASLWSVSDLSTMLLLTRFYHLWRQDGREPAAALRAAQQWVRDTTNAEKAAYFKTALTAQPNVNTPGSAADYLYKQMLLSRPDQRDFAHPFHWAAFSYTGV